MNVLVTGISGYIGGQTALLLKDQGHRVIGVDQRKLPQHLKNACDKFYTIDFENIASLELIKKYNIDAVVHCAGTSLVGPSIKYPDTYYENNFVKTKRLLDHLTLPVHNKVKFIFSSSAAVYGDPVMVPCRETDPSLPISPYGESKLMIEMMLTSYGSAYGLNSTAFRYFNACGADSQGRHGQEPGATHIVARLLESIKNKQEFVLNGNDFATPDGTCIRDYVHVEDIARAHVTALDHPYSGIYNLGNSCGHSNTQVIDTVKKITGLLPNIVPGPPRPGDPAELTASAEKWHHETGWEPKFDLEQMVLHAWNWYNR